MSRAVALLDRLGIVMEGDGTCLGVHLTLGEILGREGEAAHVWLHRFLIGDAPRLVTSTAQPHAEMAVVLAAMRATPDDARRALDLVRSMRAASQLPPIAYPFVEDAERGLDHLLAGDDEATIEAWRPVIGTRLSAPAAVFDRSGRPDLGTRVDAPDVDSTLLAGAHPAAAREAERMLARGERERARELARRVIEAWEIADDPGPFVPRMQTVLSAIDAH